MINKKIYLDNASTSFPKPAQVAEAVYKYMTEAGCNINRGCYNDAYSVEELVFETRELLCDFFGGDDCKNVVFTKNITESLNTIIKGLFKAGDHVLVSAMEHNAIMRPLNQLQKAGVTYSRIPCHADGTLCTDTLDELIFPNTRAIILTHASNVCGALMPITEIGEFCHRNNLYFIVDSAQTAGVFPIDMQSMHIDALAFTGHKGLLGPQGIGGFIIKEHLINKIEPLISGGTGSISHTEDIPEFMPDRFEAGTLNLPGIIGLRAGLLWIKSKTMTSIREHELLLTKTFIDKLLPLAESGYITIAGPTDCSKRTGVISLQFLNTDQANAAYQLDTNYNIMTRVGLHCAPNAHKTLGTYPEGTVRFSFGFDNTMQDVDAAVQAITEICHGI